ncbi:hypothetical protein A0H81_03163 [Grifola frondosa]|uniref:Uncharacterized protein n=1 Tax=Grifola frondosa TaxID=5627 RepID=A0A1C7MIL7_GRIFR|nr:hypothetical protein A0H81_03163 [Grifola frondosa]
MKFLCFDTESPLQYETTSITLFFSFHSERGLSRLLSVSHKIHRSLPENNVNGISVSIYSKCLVSSFRSLERRNGGVLCVNHYRVARLFFHDGCLASCPSDSYRILCTFVLFGYWLGGASHQHNVEPSWVNIYYNHPLSIGRLLRSMLGPLVRPSGPKIRLPDMSLVSVAPFYHGPAAGMIINYLRRYQSLGALCAPRSP